MSSDIKIQNLCDHRINWQQYSLQSDKKTIRFNYPIGSSKSFHLRVNGIEKSRKSYVLKTDKSPLTDILNSVLVFNKRVKDFQPLIEVSYVTVLQYCPKCLGTKYLDDAVYNNSGDFTQVENERLLIQEVEKYIVTRVSSNPFHRWLGTQLHELIGTKILDLDLLRSRVLEQVNSALDQLKRIQQQLVSSGRVVTDGELFDQLLSVDLEPDESDPSIVHVIVRFTARSGKTLEYVQLLELSQFRNRLAFS